MQSCPAGSSQIRAGVPLGCVAGTGRRGTRSGPVPTQWMCVRRLLGHRRDAPAADGQVDQQLHDGKDVDPGLAVLRDHRVEVDQVRDPLGDVVGHGADVASELLPGVAVAGQGGREDAVPGRLQQRHHASPAFSAVPGTVDQQEDRHESSVRGVRVGTFPSWPDGSRVDPELETIGQGVRTPSGRVQDRTRAKLTPDGPVPSGAARRGASRPDRRVPGRLPARAGRLLRRP